MLYVALRAWLLPASPVTEQDRGGDMVRHPSLSRDHVQLYRTAFQHVIASAWLAGSI